MKIYSDIFKLKHNGIRPKQGSVLISEPFAPDAIFSRAVILLAEHNEKGTVGFILNKPINKTISQLSSEFGKNDMKVAIGGPVENQRIYYIHTYGNKIPDSIEITKGLYWGGDFKVLQTAMEAGGIDENKIRFFVGYSGWQEKQLDEEIKKDFWLVSEIDVNTIMNNDKNIWNKIIAKLDKRYHIWQYFPENPNFN